jgi:putative addiction module component (TIGR02574 family)
MTSASRKLLDEALGLSEEDRLDLASELIASVDGPPDAGWEASWQAELERRSTSARERGAPTQEWTAVRQRILARLPRP